jgi:hypothetical protein
MSQSSPETSTLKPCPLCQSRASFIEQDFPPIGFRYGVECRECDCRCDYRKTSKEEAAAQWNWRPSDLAQRTTELIPTPEQIEPILDDYLGVDCPHYEEMRRRCAQRIFDLCVVMSGAPIQSSNRIATLDTSTLGNSE